MAPSSTSKVAKKMALIMMYNRWPDQRLCSEFTRLDGSDCGVRMLHAEELEE